MISLFYKDALGQQNCLSLSIAPLLSATEWNVALNPPWRLFSTMKPVCPAGKTSRNPSCPQAPLITSKSDAFSNFTDNSVATVKTPRQNHHTEQEQEVSVPKLEHHMFLKGSFW